MTNRTDTLQSYLSTLGSTELLSREGEGALGQRLELCETAATRAVR